MVTLPSEFRFGFRVFGIFLCSAFLSIFFFEEKQSFASAGSVAGRKILVTGATGFLGSHLVDRLVESGARVRVLIREGSDTYRIADVLEQVEVIEGDITNQANVLEALRGQEWVVHAAAYVNDWGPQQVFESTNVSAVESIARSARTLGIERFVHISTVDVYQPKVDGLVVDDSPLHRSQYNYARTKYDGEERVRRWIEKGLPAVILRPTWIYGPGGDPVFTEMIHALRKGQMVYFSSPDKVFNLNYVGNLVDLIITVLLAPAESVVGRAFISNDNEPISMGEMVEAIKSELGIRSRVPTLPRLLAMGVGTTMEACWRLLGIQTRPTLTRETVDFLTRGTEFQANYEGLDFQPSVSRADGLNRTFEWYRGRELETLPKR